MVAKPLGQKYRREHDPYNGMEVPDFQAQHILLEGEKNLPKIEQEADDSKRQYRHRKQSAATRIRQSEENQSSSLVGSSHYQNKVMGRNPIDMRAKAKGSTKKRFGKLAPASIITVLLGGGAVLFYVTQSMLGPTISNLYTRATDIQYPSYMTRNQRVFKYMLDGGDQLKLSNNLTKRYTTFSPYIKRRLANNGIEVGYLDKSGNFSTKQAIANKNTVLKYGDEIIRADDFQSKFASDANFREAYTKAKRGRVAGFFDSSADKFYDNNNRNRFVDFGGSGDSKIDDQNFRETVNNSVTGSDASVNSVHSKNASGDDEVGKNGDTIEAGKIDGDTPEAKARTLVNSLASKVERGSTGARVACAGLRIANMAAVTVSAYQIFQSISYFLTMTEPISKAIAGEGASSPANEVLNFFTSVTDSVVQRVDANGKTKNVVETGSPLQASGAQLILTSTPVNKDKVAPYSINNIFSSAALVAATTGATHLTCDGVMAGSAIVSLAANAVPGGTLAKFVVNAVANTVGGIAITAAVGAIVKTIIPYVAKIFTNDIFQSYNGIPAGEFYTQGAATANFKLATQASGFMPASEDYVKKQNRETAVVLAQEAEVDRLGRSPFDISSPNTFLGSLFSKFAFSTIGSTFGNGLAGFGNLIHNSFNALNPTASAANEDVVYTSSYGDCGNNGLDTVCDIYGTVIPARDYSTINLKPDNKKYNAIISSNLDSNGKIIEGSELSKFISFCAERESPWGVLDANIMNALQTDFGIVGNNLYLVEDAVDIINAAEDAKNRAWGTGENCVMSSQNPRWDNEFKYYQAYMEDMRIISGFNGEQSTTSSTNPVLAYIDEYEEKHPVDTSFEGTLARISGYTKDDISFLLEFTRYSSEIANIDYSNLFAFGENSSEFVEKPENSEFNAPQIFANVLYTPDLFVDRRNYTV